MGIFSRRPKNAVYGNRRTERAAERRTHKQDQAERNERAHIVARSGFHDDIQRIENSPDTHVSPQDKARLSATMERNKALQRSNELASEYMRQYHCPVCNGYYVAPAERHNLLQPMGITERAHAHHRRV